MEREGARESDRERESEEDKEKEGVMRQRK
jgi:hypothetical protein